MLAQNILFPGMNNWPKPPLVECAHCAALVPNDYGPMDRHVRWHEFIILVGVTLNLSYQP